MTLRFPLMVAALAAFLVSGAGCANNKLEAERASLVNQNKDLNEKLQASEAARQSESARANAVSSQLTATPPEAAPSMTGGGPLELTGPIGRGSARTTTPARTGTASTPARTAATTRVKLPGPP